MTGTTVDEAVRPSRCSAGMRVCGTSVVSAQRLDRATCHRRAAGSQTSGRRARGRGSRTHGELVDVDDRAPEGGLVLVVVAHTDLSEVTRVVLVKVGAVVVLTTGKTTTSRVLAVLADTSVTGGDVPPVLARVREAGRHDSPAGSTRVEGGGGRRVSLGV